MADMAADSGLKKIPPIAYIAGVLILALIAGLGYYIGKKQGAQPSVPVASAPVPANKFVRLPPERFGNWNLACGQNPQKVKRCSLVLDAVNKDKRPILGLRLLRNARGRALLLVIAPPGAILSAGVHIAPEGGKELVARFVQCGKGACEAIAPFDEAGASAYTAAANLTVKFVAGNGKPMAIKIPNTGFEAAYQKWLEVMPAPPAGAPAAPAAPPPAGSAPSDTTTPPNDGTPPQQ